MSATSKLSERLEETVVLLERGMTVMFFAVVVVTAACFMILVGAVTFATLHPGDDLDFGGSSGHSGDVIILPAQPF